MVISVHPPALRQQAKILVTKCGGLMMADAKTADKLSPWQTALMFYLAAASVTAYTAWAISVVGFAWPALLLLPVLALLLPFSRSALRAKIRFIPGLGLSLGIAVVYVLALGVMMGEVKAKLRQATELRAQQDSIARVAKAKAEREAEYAKNKANVIAQVEQHLANNQPREALATINKFMTVTKDPDLGRLQPRAEVQVMKLDLQSENTLSLERREQIYTTLMREDFANKVTYERKLKDLEPQLAALRKAREDEAKKAAMSGRIDGQFSKFDGSHRNVEAALKARLKDPGSYEHVGTKYIVNPDSITVFTTYRARNSFNAVVTSTAVANVDADGKVLSLN